MTENLVQIQKVHPAADLFPMMTPEELQELADDIAENGQQEPIIMDGDVLIDGRNRLEACRLAEVEPFFADLPKGRDPLAYIASANLMRRNLTKGQQAMAMAMIYPEPDGRGRGKKGQSAKLALSANFSLTRITQARSVLHYSPELAQSVLGGTTPLNEALAKVQDEQNRARSTEQRLTQLAKTAPDLAEQVREERLTLSEAIAACGQRESDRRLARESGQRSAENLDRFCADVLAVQGGIEAGAEIRFPEGIFHRIRETYKILMKLEPTKGAS